MNKKKILVLSPHPERVAPGQRLKYEQYFSYFRKNNYEITVSPFRIMPFEKIVHKKGHIPQKFFFTLVGYARRIYDLIRLPFYDGAYVFLYVTPFGSPFFEFLMRIMTKTYIYDIDDMVFLQDKSDANPYISFFKGKKKMSYLMKHAGYVITCSEALEKYAKKYNLNTIDISSTINTDTYKPVNSYKNDHKIVLGWSGSISTSKYLYLLKDVLIKLRTKHDFILRVIGDPKFYIDGLEIESLPWVEASEVKDLQKIDIGLYPLPDDPWVYGKSGLKAIQYMGLGIPTVASKIGSNQRVIENGISGFLVSEEEEWVEKIELLINNCNLRKSMGEKGRGRVEDLFSIKANSSTYLSIFQSVYR